MIELRYSKTFIKGMFYVPNVQCDFWIKQIAILGFLDFYSDFLLKGNKNTKCSTAFSLLK